MTNSIAMGLAVLVLGGIALDLVLNGGDTLVFLAKKLFELIEYLAFWR